MNLPTSSTEFRNEFQKKTVGAGGHRKATYTLPKTNSEFTPENRGSQKETRKYSNHPFSGAFAVRFREGINVNGIYKSYGPIRVK